MIKTLSALASVMLSEKEDSLNLRLNVLLCWADGVYNEYSAKAVKIHQLVLDSGHVCIGAATSQRNRRESRLLSRMEEIKEDYPKVYSYTREFFGSIQREVDKDAFIVLAYQCPILTDKLQVMIAQSVINHDKLGSFSSVNGYVVERGVTLNPLAIRERVDLKDRIRGLADALCDGLLVRTYIEDAFIDGQITIPEVSLTRTTCTGTWRDVIERCQTGMVLL